MTAPQSDRFDNTTALPVPLRGRRQHVPPIELDNLALVVLRRVHHDVRRAAFDELTDGRDVAGGFRVLQCELAS